MLHLTLWYPPLQNFRSVHGACRHKSGFVRDARVGVQTSEVGGSISFCTHVGTGEAEQCFGGREGFLKARLSFVAQRAVRLGACES